MEEKNVIQDTPDTSDSDKELIESFIALNAMLHSLSSMLSASTKVTLSDLVAYEHIRLYGPLSAKDVAQRVQMGSGATTALIDRLEQRGYVKRAAHPTDRRSVMVQALTTEPLSVAKLDAFLERLVARIARLEPPQQQLISAFFKDITEDGLETLK